MIAMNTIFCKKIETQNCGHLKRARFKCDVEDSGAVFANKYELSYHKTQTFRGKAI